MFPSLSCLSAIAAVFPTNGEPKALTWESSDDPIPKKAQECIRKVQACRSPTTGKIILPKALTSGDREISFWCTHIRRGEQDQLGLFHLSCAVKGGLEEIVQEIVDSSPTEPSQPHPLLGRRREDRRLPEISKALAIAIASDQMRLFEKLFLAGKGQWTPNTLSEPLGAAVARRNTKVYDELFAAGEGKWAEDSLSTSLSAAAGSGDKEVFDRLLAMPHVRWTFGHLFKAIAAAGAKGQVIMLEHLLVRGADHLSSERLEEPLKATAAAGCVATLEMLLAATTEPWIPNSLLTAATAAAAAGRVATLEMLLAATIHPWPLDYLKRLLESAAQMDQAETLQTVLTAGAGQWTPEILKSILRVLVKTGTRPTFRIMLNVYRGHWTFTTLKESFEEAMQQGQIEKIRDLIEGSTGDWPYDDILRKALGLAIRKRDRGTGDVILAIARGQWTPSTLSGVLLDAIESDDEEMFQRLLHATDVPWACSDLNTALNTAITRRCHFLKGILRATQESWPHRDLIRLVREAARLNQADTVQILLDVSKDPWTYEELQEVLAMTKRNGFEEITTILERTAPASSCSIQ
jgi:hypothetical protein